MKRKQQQELSQPLPSTNAKTKMIGSLLSTIWVGALILCSRGTLSFTSAAQAPSANTVLGSAAALAAKSSRSNDEGDFSEPMTNRSIFNAGEVIFDPASQRRPLKVLFLSADTGGGHRASAESLANQFQIHYPGTTYDLLDIWTLDGVWPYRTLVDSYKHLSATPSHWRFLYHLSNTRPWEIMVDVHSIFMCEKKIRKRIASYDPDVVVSVHPAMQLAPIKALRKLSKEKGKHIPFYTVVTDLASGHTTWFQKKTEKMYLASERLYRLARRRGGTPKENIVMTGLPIRHDFAVQAEELGDRTSPAGLRYQMSVRKELGLDANKPMILLMGGGEGVGSLSTITNEIYAALVRDGVDATICVVCGRNDKLKNELAERDWDAVLRGEHRPKKKGIFARFRHRRSRTVQDALDHRKDVGDGDHGQGNVDVVGLGFVTRMAEYMVAADILVSKAGPGTIAEAAAVGLPVMLTSFLPGQEAGNVDFVLEGGFGDFSDDPVEIGEEVSTWLRDPELMKSMSAKARETGHPNAASEIVLDIGSRTQTWMALNDEKSLP